MREEKTHLGKKEQRQIDHLLRKEAEGSTDSGKEPEARASPKQHRLKPRRTRKG